MSWSGRNCNGPEEGPNHLDTHSIPVAHVPWSNHAFAHKHLDSRFAKAYHGFPFGFNLSGEGPQLQNTPRRVRRTHKHRFPCCFCFQKIHVGVDQKPLYIHGDDHWAKPPTKNNCSSCPCFGARSMDHIYLWVCLCVFGGYLFLDGFKGTPNENTFFLGAPLKNTSHPLEAARWPLRTRERARTCRRRRP